MLGSRLAVAQRAAVPPFHVMDVLAAASMRRQTHGDLVNMAAGQPFAPPSAPVMAAAREALSRPDQLGYTVALGISELRAAIAGHYRGRYGLDVTADDVVATTGSSGGFLLAFLAAFDVGDRVAMGRPGYPCYRNILAALGCTVVELPCGPHTRFQPTLAMLEALDEPIDGLVVASPANPTGTVLPPDELAAIARWCDANGVQLISDEIYHGITYGAGTGNSTDSAGSAGSAGNGGGMGTACAWHTSREAIVVNSFSKYFTMTGWRLGWLLVPERLRRAVECLTGNFNICPPALAQHAAVAAFTEESYAELGAHVQGYAHNRKLLLDGLPTIGLDRLAPADGAFYIYADVSGFTSDSLDFCRRLLADTGLAIAPGIDFDTVDGGGHVRMSFAGATEDIEEALRRLGSWLP
jgi:aspartate/methionine/tyrosine aminotransferase